MLALKEKTFGVQLAATGVGIGCLGALLAAFSSGGTESTLFVIGYGLGVVGVVVCFVGVAIHIVRSLEDRKRQ